MTRLKNLPRTHLIAGVVLFLLVLYPVLNPWQPYPQGVLLLAFLLAVQATSWNIISGYAGYVSLGHSMFLGLGSYTAAIIALHDEPNDLRARAVQLLEGLWPNEQGGLGWAMTLAALRLCGAPSEALSEALTAYVDETHLFLDGVGLGWAVIALGPELDALRIPT